MRIEDTQQNKSHSSQASWHMPVILSLGRQRQGDTSLGYTEKPLLFKADLPTTGTKAW